MSGTMPDGITGVLDRLDAIAAYDGPWDVLDREIPLLKQRLAELRERETRLDDLLVVALVGGSGVGKSTLLNAIAGDQLARTSEFRPCTSAPTVYHPPGARLPFAGEWKRVSGSALENLVVIDTPDSDTIVHEHRAYVIEVLKQCDLIVVCADAEKYLDEATWSLLRPLQNERAIVCVETKASSAPTIREHWQKRMDEENFRVSAHFRVNSLRAFDRKTSGRGPDDEEYEFPAFERFLYEELTRERIQRIKRSNTAGLLAKTLTTLEERTSSRLDQLQALETTMKEKAQTVTKESVGIVQRRLFAEPHLWNYAIGREVGLRAKGVVQSLFRLIEWARSMPARMASWSIWPGRSTAGRQAAALLSDEGVLNIDVNVASDELHRAYVAEESEARVELAKAGFTAPDRSEGFEDFLHDVNERVARVFHGPARDRVVGRARGLTSWPIAILLDLPPLAFFGFSAYTIVADYFSSLLWSGAEFLHAATVLAIILAVEIFLISVAARFMAWTARIAATKDLRLALLTDLPVFKQERDALTGAQEITKAIASLKQEILGAEGEENGA